MCINDRGKNSKKSQHAHSWVVSFWCNVNFDACGAHPVPYHASATVLYPLFAIHWPASRHVEGTKSSGNCDSVLVQAPASKLWGSFNCTCWCCTNISLRLLPSFSLCSTTYAFSISSWARFQRNSNYFTVGGVQEVGKCEACIHPASAKANMNTPMFQS